MFQIEVSLFKYILWFYCLFCFSGFEEEGTFFKIIEEELGYNKVYFIDFICT